MAFENVENNTKMAPKRSVLNQFIYFHRLIYNSTVRGIFGGGGNSQKVVNGQKFKIFSKG